MPPKKPTEVKVDYDVILVDIDKLVPNPRNANQHDAEQIGQIAGSMLSFGWTDPIIIWKDNMIIAGHGRRLAAQSLKITKAPCIDCSHMTENEARAFALAHNRITRNSDPDLEMMGIELRELANADWSLTDLGFNQDEIDEALTAIESTDFPDLPEGDQPDFRQVTFTLHTSQVETVKQALERAEVEGLATSDKNDNSNANALAGVCAAFMVQSHGVG